MATVTEIRDRFKNLLNSLGSIIVSTYKDTEKDAVKLQQDQWDVGLRADGGQIGQYSDFTKSIKKRKGQETEFVTLQDSGALIKSIKFTSIVEEYAEIDATDGKRDKVVSGDNNYGEDIFGLMEQNTYEYANDSWLKSFGNRLRKLIWRR